MHILVAFHSFVWFCGFNLHSLNQHTKHNIYTTAYMVKPEWTHCTTEFTWTQLHVCIQDQCIYHDGKCTGDLSYPLHFWLFLVHYRVTIESNFDCGITVEGSFTHLTWIQAGSRLCCHCTIKCNSFMQFAYWNCYIHQ